MYNVTNIFNTTQCNCHSMISMWTVIIFVQGNFSFLCVCTFSPLENLAFQKPTYQHLKTLVNGTSDRAVDGNSNINFAGESCSFVQDNPFPWWRVDLGQDEFVTEVYVVGLHDVHRLTKFEIKVGRLIHLQ